VSVAGVILAGGLSTRMGSPKEGVRLPDSRTMMEAVGDALRPLVAELVVVGASRGFHPARLGARRIDDLRSDGGPLAGIEAALASGIAHHYLVATCDQPLLTTELLRLLLPPTLLPAALLTSDGAELLPFPCLVSAGLARAAQAALDAGERSPRRWLRSFGIDRRMAPAEAVGLVRSINTPEELAALRDHIPAR